MQSSIFAGFATGSYPARSRRERRGLARCGWLPAATLVAMALIGTGGAVADVRPETMNGPPLLPIPTYEEVGLPTFTMPTGRPTGQEPEQGGGTAPSDGTPSGTGGTGDGADSRSMTSMMSRSWGEAASQNAETVGITPVALAATCQIEASGCQTNPRSNSTTITGTFQMRDDTYTSMINAALARNPSLAANAVPGLAGKLDPATQSIAAAEYLRQGAVALQATGYTPNPTVLDVRGYYNFGPSNASAIARAPDNAVMSDLVTLTANGYRGNGITPGVTTVGQWRASVTDKIGQSAAQAPVLLARS